MARQRHFDLILLDISMPGAGGIEACRHLRALSSNVAIVMVTVREAEEDMVEALEAGADDYITKPFRFGELVVRLRAVLRRAWPDTHARQYYGLAIWKLTSTEGCCAVLVMRFT